MDNEYLSKEQVNTVVQFAKGLYDVMAGYYNPMDMNNQLLEVNGCKLKPTYKDIIKCLDEIPYNGDKLAQYSDFMKTFDSIYNSTIEYYVGLLSFNLGWTCMNATPTDYSRKGYEQDLKRVHKFFDGFNYKEEFKKALRRMATRDAYYVWLRDSKDLKSKIDLESQRTEKFALQTMPQEYCKITGQFDGGLMYDIDLNYFIKPNVDINRYPDAIKNMCKGLVNGTEKYMPYNPSASLDKRHTSYGVNYRQTSPLDGAWVFKWDNTSYGVCPPFASLIKICIDDDDMYKLQKDKNILSAYQILTGSIETNDKAEVKDKDALKLNPNTLGMFLSLVNRQIADKVKPVALPLADIKNYQFQEYNGKMVDNHYRNAVSPVVSASELITHSENLSQFAMQNAIETDYAKVEPLYRQFEDFLNFFVNMKTEKYKFKFTFNGLNRSWWQKEYKDNILALADKGMVLPKQFWSGCVGLDPTMFMRALEETKATKWVDKDTCMLPNANTMSSDENANGRPKKEGLDKSDKTEEVQESVN